jgi:MscS family membrane protein
MACRHVARCALLLGVLLLPAPAPLAQTAAPPSDADFEQLQDFDWVDTSSPRATFQSFLIGAERVFAILREDGITWSNQRLVHNLVSQGRELFDLRSVPPNLRDDVSAETGVFLREALARVPMPPLDEIPNEDEMAARIRDGKSPIFSVPNTPFEIELTEDGPFAGRYQFTHDTVAHAHDFFREIRRYPYQPGQMHIQGFYEAYFLSPGPLIPSRWIRSLPSWMQREFDDQAIWQWFSLVFSAFALFAAIYFVHVLVERMTRDWRELSRKVLFLVRLLLAAFLVRATEYFLDEQVFLTGGALQTVVFGSRLLTLGVGVGLTLMCGDVLAAFLLNNRRSQRRQLDRQLFRLGIRVLAIAAAIVIVIEGMQRLGFSIATLLAGASVTGLAVALAAQDTLKNIFGGITLSLDKPFVPGQRVLIKGHTGDVEEVGLRSTRIRTLAGHQISIPNEEAARIEIENIGRRPHIRRDLNVTIKYDTPPGKIRLALETLEDILALPEKRGGDDDRPHHPNERIHHRAFAPRVYFNELNPDSLTLLAVYWFRPADWWHFQEHSTWVNLQVMERFTAEGIEFAFPSRTVYLASDDKRPADLSGLTRPPDDGVRSGDA